MSRIGQTALVVSHPRPTEFPPRAALITADHGDGTVDVAVFNPHSTGPASVREASMPAVQTMGPIPVAYVNGDKPADYRGRWIAVIKQPAVNPHLSEEMYGQLSEEERKGLGEGEVVPVSTVAKSKSSKPTKR